MGEEGRMTQEEEKLYSFVVNDTTLKSMHWAVGLMLDEEEFEPAIWEDYELDALKEMHRWMSGLLEDSDA